jgi:hypothetical protein
VASWTVIEDQVVWISPRVTSFTVICNACAQFAAYDGYSGAAVSGTLPLEARRGTLECPRGHRLQVQRELR